MLCPNGTSHQKNRDVRICADLKRLNEAIIRKKYVLPIWMTSLLNWRSNSLFYPECCQQFLADTVRRRQQEVDYFYNPLQERTVSVIRHNLRSRDISETHD